MNVNNEQIFYRLNRIDQKNTEIIDELLADDYVPKTSDAFKENQLFGSCRRFNNEIEEAYFNNK